MIHIGDGVYEEDLTLARACRECGCTDERACPGGCWWVPDDQHGGYLCSSCAPDAGGEG